MVHVFPLVGFAERLTAMVFMDTTGTAPHFVLIVPTFEWREKGFAAVTLFSLPQ
jgi:hypothetical protein